MDIMDRSILQARKQFLDQAAAAGIPKSKSRDKGLSEVNELVDTLPFEISCDAEAEDGCQAARGRGEGKRGRGRGFLQLTTEL